MSAPALSEPRIETAFPGGLSALVDRYDGFLLDQWGVLHDGDVKNTYATKEAA